MSLSWFYHHRAGPFAVVYNRASGLKIAVHGLGQPVGRRRPHRPQRVMRAATGTIPPEAGGMVRFLR
jgi:hypothetical protein